ncbi:hypothetical protein CEP52_008220 [Fusarium oligoseptatum]|uniref:Uncharacterized protein n=1 Tax=Fusarium oligoseptatum TaxID=2604345 RepID=A0A428TJ27_9HYPO|nr:hypothetical protein CEP52_008220 [Fusarium oligoseptatum]
MSLIPLADGTIVVHTQDPMPDPHTWDNFDHNISSRRVLLFLRVHATRVFCQPERTWRERIEATERALRIQKARKAAFTPPPSPPPPAPHAPNAQ